MSTENIQLKHIAKVEGHADLDIHIINGELVRCELGTVEGARFFEGLVVGRRYDELKEITSRICGICSVGHSMSSIKAVENAFGLKPTKQTKLLREFMTIGERIRSHATHLYMLVLPDFVGYESAVAMAPKFKAELARAMRLIKLGNEIVTVVAGRQMHPVASIVGGFTHTPTQEQMTYLQTLIKTARKDALDTLKLFLTLKYPELHRDVEHICLYQKGSVPLLEGRVVSDQGLSVEEHEYEALIEEYIEPQSTAKFAVREGKEYYLGALARMTHAYDSVAPDIKKLVKTSKIPFPSKNPFHQSVAQAVELVHWMDIAVKLIKEMSFKPEPIQDITPKAGKGVGITEVPRGLLIHSYEFDENGICTKCNIMTPTCQYLRTMQLDLQAYIQSLIDHKKSKETIIFETEKLIRSYDPCFSCSAHFLRVNWNEE